MKKNYILAGALLCTVALTVPLKAKIFPKRKLYFKNVDKKKTYLISSEGFRTNTKANPRILKPGQKHTFWLMDDGDEKKEIVVSLPFEEAKHGQELNGST